ncbi:MAG: porin family protein [Alistipes sp.]
MLLLFLGASAMAQSSNRANNAQSQRKPRVRVEWGVMGGVNFTGFSSGGLQEIREKVGYQAGISMALNFGRFAIRPEILYVRQRLDVARLSTDPLIALKSNTIDVPILFSLRLFRPLRLNVGPVFSVMSSCKYTDAEGLKVDFGSVRPTTSYTVGLSLLLAQHLMVDARFIGHFSSSGNIFSADGGEIKMRANSFAVSVGYIF